MEREKVSPKEAKADIFFIYSIYFISFFFPIENNVVYIYIFTKCSFYVLLL